jgi:phosphate starvation-inducible protein PhoH
LFGENDQNLKRLKTRLEAKILARGDSIRIEGEASHVKIAEGLIRDLLAVVRQGGSVTLEEVDRGAKVSSDGGSYLEDISTHIPGESVLELPKRLKPKTKGQKIYVDAIMSNEITFGIGPAGTGKCVAGDTLVLTGCGVVPISSLGRNVNVDEQRPTPTRIFGLRGKEWASHVYNGGVTDTIQISTRYGSQIEGTPEHPLMTINTNGELEWVRLDQVRVGTKLAMFRGSNMWGEQTQIDFEYARSHQDHSSRTINLNELTPDFAYFMGLIVGDGCMTRRGWVLFSSRDQESRDHFAQIAQQLGLPISKHNQDQRLNSTQLAGLLEHLGIGTAKSHQKTVPESILRAPREIVIAFLQGMFDTDGTVSRRDGYPSLCSSSEQLARTVQLLLLNLGIIGKLWRKHTTHLDTFILEMRGLEASKFFDTVGFRLERKQTLRQHLKAGHNTNLDVIPNLASSIREAARAQQLPRAEHKWLNDYKTGRRNPSYSQLARIITTCNAQSAARERLATILEKHFIWNEVIELKPSQAQVYDLTVPGSHSFSAGGFVNHNSYLAVAMAVAHFKAKRVKRIILTRPAVEAGERLGFLPGDLQAKIDPYLRPLYDALLDMIEPERFESYITSGAIEVAPLAFMRGRTLSDAFVILDEAQNTTPEQMKMFLTRMGFSSKVVVTGDITQVDLPKNITSGLEQARRLLTGIPGIEFVKFDETDVVRHPLVGEIVKAYDQYDEAKLSMGSSRGNQPRVAANTTPPVMDTPATGTSESTLDESAGSEVE